MELRVWLEGGPQRVVCGVTEATTCQDVVYALAQATAQTGRFALVERCRRSERPLAPSDRPLRLLARRAGASADVHFLLRRCGPPPPLPPASRLPTDPAGPGPLPAATWCLPQLPPQEGDGGQRPRRPPPYEEAVTRLAEGQERAQLTALVGRQKERLRALAHELARTDAPAVPQAHAVFSLPECPAGTVCAERPLEEQLQRLLQEERGLRAELSRVRSQLAACEGRLLHCRQQLAQLGQQVSEEEGLSERRRLVAQLSAELRAANLEALALADADHKHWLEAASGGFFNRPGSTRKIVGSPRQLESAVPTSKNPNGVWV
ncbi:ras association domain-containing protein 8 isoform X1 [Haemaphysalis longicornis]